MFCVIYISILMLSLLTSLTNCITCYVCESYNDFRCLDPFDYQPFVQIDCDNAPFVRDKVPVFCEKRTEVVDNVYVTTRGCSTDYRWEDVRGYQDIIGGQIPCIRRKNKETCLCTNDRCNQSHMYKSSLIIVLSMFLLTLKL